MLSLDVETRIYVGDVIFSTELSMTSFLLRVLRTSVFNSQTLSLVRQGNQRRSDPQSSRVLKLVEIVEEFVFLFVDKLNFLGTWMKNVIICVETTSASLIHCNEL